MIGVDMWQDGQIDSRFVKVRFVRTHPNAKLPTKGTEDAVGFDLYAVE
jgi:dUTPase